VKKLPDCLLLLDPADSFPLGEGSSIRPDGPPIGLRLLLAAAEVIRLPLIRLLGLKNRFLSRPL